MYLLARATTLPFMKSTSDCLDREVKDRYSIGGILKGLEISYTSCSCSVDQYNIRMYSVQCTVYSVQCTVYSVQCTVYSVQCTVYSVQCWCTVNSVKGEHLFFRTSTHIEVLFSCLEAIT